MTPDDPPDAKEREALLQRIMERQGVAREVAEALLARADAEVLRMRDA